MTRTEQLRALTNEVKATLPDHFTGGIKISYNDFAKFNQIYDHLNNAGIFEQFFISYLITLEKRIEELEDGR